jgi:conjugal transfer ATP-binding protein TraC
MADPQNAADLVPIIAYDPDNKLFYGLDNTIAFGFVCRGLWGGDQRTEQRMRSLLIDSWPDDAILQISLVAGSNLYDEFQDIRELRPARNHQVLRDMVDARIAYLAERVDASFSGQNGLTLRRFDVYVVGKVPARSSPVELDEVAEISKLRWRVENSLKSVGFRPAAMSEHEFVRHLGSIVNRSGAGSWRIFGGSGAREDLLLSEQVFDPGTDVRIERGGVWLDDVWVQALSPKTFPRQLSFGMAARYIGDPVSGSAGLTCPFIVTLNVSFEAGTVMRRRIGTRRNLLMAQASGPLAKWLPGVKARFGDMEALQGSVDQGHRAVRASLSLILFSAAPGGGESDFAARCAQAMRKGEEDRARAQNFWSTAMFTMLADRFIAHSVLLNSLPFFADRRAVRDLGRYRTMSTEHVGRLAPIFSDWQGTGTPSLSLVSRNGALMSLCLFDSGTNYNATIAAQSGSGKSFLANEMMTSYLSQGALVWVVDVGYSYRNLSEVLDGQFVDIGAVDICFNPFPLIQDYDEEVDVLEAVVAAMASPTEMLSDYQRAVLSRTMRELYERSGVAMTIDEIAEALKQNDDERVRDIGVRLYMFTTAGQYGRFFNGANTVSFARAFTVLEMEGLRNRKHLQRIILLMLIYAIQQKMYLGDPGQKKLLFIDEAWELLSDGEAGKFIEVGYRRFRKYNGAVVTITQSIADFYSSRVGEAILANSANMLLLGQRPETIDQLTSSGRLALEPFAIGVLKTVHTIAGVYSEIYARTDRGEGVGRLIVDAFTQLLYSTRPADRAAIRRYTEQGLSVSDAARAVIAERRAATQLQSAAE